MELCAPRGAESELQRIRIQQITLQDGGKLGRLAFMKGSILGSVGSLLIVVGALHGQDFVAPDAPSDLPVTPVRPDEPLAIEGVVAAIFKNPQPLQLINPLAPASEGNGEAFVSRNPDDPEKPKGIIFFGIEW